MQNGIGNLGKSFPMVCGSDGVVVFKGRSLGFLEDIHAAFYRRGGKGQAV
jgi:hypothetical protein